MPGKQQQRKMVNIDVTETSGVDHPAHLHEGWIVKKGVSPDTIANLFGTQPPKEPTVPTIDPTNAEDLTKAKLVTQEAYDKVKDERDELKGQLAAAVKKDADEAAVAKAAELPEEVRLQLAKSAADQEALREELAKEREARLDGEVIRKSKDTFRALAFDHDVVAPGLRKMALIDPELASTLESVLKAADAQLDSAGLFATFGKDVNGGDGDSASAKLDAAVSKQLEADPKLNRSQAIAKAVEANPALYEELNKEAGK